MELFQKAWIFFWLVFCIALGLFVIKKIARARALAVGFINFGLNMVCFAIMGGMLGLGNYKVGAFSIYSNLLPLIPFISYSVFRIIEYFEKKHKRIYFLVRYFVTTLIFTYFIWGYILAELFDTEL